MGAYEKFLLVAYCVLIPLAIFVALQIMREFKGVWLSGGADVIGVLLAFDATVIYAPTAYVPIVRTVAFHSSLTQTAGLSLIIGFVLALVIVFYGEKVLADPVTTIRRRLGGGLPKRPFIIIWGCAVSFISAHLLFFLGVWS